RKGKSESKRQGSRPCRSRLALPCRRTGLRNHGAYDSRARKRTAGSAVRSPGFFTARRNGSDVPVDERVPFAALAEAVVETSRELGQEGRAKMTSSGYRELRLFRCRYIDIIDAWS